PGPALVLAGAGAGKTRTLTYRVAYLLEQGIPPEHVLLLTFTNKAAREMMTRVTELIGRELPELWGGTFHSIGNRILRRHAGLLGFRPGFTILDREDARDLVHACIGDSDIDPKATRFPKPDVLGDILSLALNTSRSVKAVLEAQFGYFAQLADQIADIGHRYVERKRTGNVMDFDDLLALWLRLLREQPEVLDHYQRRFQFILVDEYQDTNQLQSDLIDLLAARNHNIMAVGDDSQSIYSWRGANFRNILHFTERHAGAKIFRIETNYRSTPQILDLANAAIAANVHQHEKRLVPHRPAGVKPALVACGDAHEQATFVAQRALELREEGIPLEQMAVLYRAHFHALELQMELTGRNIPFSITSGIRFFEQAHIKDTSAFIRLVFNPRDEMAFKRLVLMLPGIGAKSAAKLWQGFLAALPADVGAGLPESSPAGKRRRKPAGPAPEVTPVLAETLQSLAGSVPKKATTAWAQFTATVAQLEAPDTRDHPSRMIELALDAVYEDYLQAKYTNYLNRREDVEQLASFARQFAGVEEFLSQLALLTNVEADAQQNAERDDERLRLSTVHQAKGLEFQVVFVIMLCDGMFPSGRSIDTADGLEEERRLFYVAVTRAKDELYLVWPMIRMAGGGDMMQQPSRFLGELPRDRLETWNLREERGADEDWGSGFRSTP
ncbi:MAG: UvrD-helicase domain-containing protein, partial [Verrucomicrobiae bacterium]|nr:UvrD-helicase domain-containing protein [Verrucomicrobiae bacterium]